MVYNFSFLFGVWRLRFCSFLYSVRTITMTMATPITFYHCQYPHISRNKARLQITDELKYYEFKFKLCEGMWSGHLVYCVLILPWHQIVVIVAADTPVTVIINIYHYFGVELNWYRTLYSDNDKSFGYYSKRCSVTMLVTGDKRFWYVICKYVWNTLW